MDFLNNNWKDYISKTEKFLYHTTQDLRYVIFYIMEAVIAYTFLVLWAYISLREDLRLSNHFLGDFLKYAGLIGLIWMLFSYFRYRSVHYVITDKGVHKIKGLFNKNDIFVPYKHILDSRVSVGFFESLFKLGSVKLSTAGGTHSYRGCSQPYENTVLHISDYKKVSEIVRKYMD